ncbi:MAG: efflux RND transporter periplasmic adaptor subunit, partial [Anaerolineales bacterium]|nr:efflux RND transporter periplasmic adaptor subunit [Anaerolineales bacterium]
EVQAGDVLARIDDTDARTALVNAELQLQQSIMQTDATSTATGTSYNEISIEQARINLEDAQANLDDLQNWEPDADEIAQAEAALKSAQASYNASLGQASASSNNIAIQQISLDQAQRALEAAQDAYNVAYDPGREWEAMYNEPTCLSGQDGEFVKCTGQTYSEKMAAERDSAENSLTRAQESLAVAQANYNSTVATSSNSSVVSADASVLNAELALAAVQAGPDEDEIKAAETAVHLADLAYQQALLNQEADQISLKQAQLNLESAQQALTDTELIAPIDGTIMTIAGHVGEQAGSSFIALADLDQPMLEVYLDETDLDKIGVDYEVDVYFDALPDDVFTGHVVQVDPQLSVVSNVTTVRDVVQLDTESFAKPQNLPVGMNATVDVIGGRAEGALLVPVEALRELSPGEYAVFVMENGEPVLRFVEVGIMDFTYAEIISGLELGETVTTGIVETQ